MSDPRPLLKFHVVYFKPLSAAVSPVKREYEKEVEFGYALDHAPDGLPILVLLRYIKKKKWELSREDIETAESRLCQL
ncbi:MAG: hypothetical protein HY747_11645 [Elusimicrobia bacterium]|nr:hypothetical protein [Elusimicrobiota bacterium]